MLHVNNRDGFTIAVSENRQLARIAKRTVLSDSAFSVVVPILEEIVGWRSSQIRELFEGYGLTLHDWEKARTDRITVHGAPVLAADGDPLMPGHPLYVEALGWAATAVFVASYFFKRAELAGPRSRSSGALMWVAYGVLVHATPVIAANLLVVGAAAWKARQAAAPRPAGLPQPSRT